jgi:tRNA-dihydrouridine synthase B
MWYKNKPILALAPMADMTDSPFCRVCREVSGEDFVIFREMVSSEALIRDSEKTLKMCELEDIERPIVIQIFGSKPEVIRKAAEIVVKKFKPDGIDINMGCPVPKIAKKSDSGVALMRDPERASNIVKELKKANLGVPVSVKTRLGWGSDDDILEFAKVIEDAGADVLTIHGRTKVQGYSGLANWDRIAEVKKLLSIPVIANGDVVDKKSLDKCLEITKADGVMIGRGALGNPWIFSMDNKNISLDERKKIILRHAELHEERYGTLVTFRKHLMYYFRGLSGVKNLKKELVKVNDFDGLKNILNSFTL